jgi:hypothetical protein
MFGKIDLTGVGGHNTNLTRDFRGFHKKAIMEDTSGENDFMRHMMGKKRSTRPDYESLGLSSPPVQELSSA